MTERSHLAKRRGLFAGRVALVTGASGGIGSAIVRRLLEEGAFVAAHYRSNRESAQALERLAPGRCRAFCADFSRTGEPLRLWEEFLTWKGTIDVLVNNAGAAPTPLPLEALTEEALDTSWTVNVKAPFLLCQAALPVMAHRGSGRIVNLSSIGVKFGGGLQTAHYSMAKAALEALTLSFAKAGAARGVLVNAVRVGVTDTSFHTKLGQTDLSSRSKLIPLGRPAQPPEIAEAVLFLASRLNTYTTGAILPVAGGE